MKVTIIKGPMFSQQEKLAHEMLYKIIRKKATEDAEKVMSNKPA